MLDYYLSRCYEDVVLKGMSEAAVLDVLRHKLEANQSLREEAQKKLSSLTDAVCQRCFLSGKYRKFLNYALNKE